MTIIQAFQDLYNQARFDADIRTIETTYRGSDKYKAAVIDATSLLDKFYSPTRRSRNAFKLAAAQGGFGG